MQTGGTRIEYAPRVAEDFARIAAHLSANDAEGIEARLDAIESAIEVLSTSPAIGRPVPDGQRELVIGKGHRGYVARYRYLAELELVIVLAIRAQREQRYRG
jgi:toxin ParE1/3/4